MEIKVQYKGQLAAENDSSNEIVNCEKPLSILELLNVILESKTPEFRKLIVNSDNVPTRSLLIVKDNVQVLDLRGTIIENDCQINLLPPIAGG